MYITSVSSVVWNIIRQSAIAADSVLTFEQSLNNSFRQDGKYAFEDRNGVVIRQYSVAYCKAYNQMLNGMIERRMKASILAVASCWFTAWVNAGQPDLKEISGNGFTPIDIQEWEELNKLWKESSLKGRSCSN